MSQAGPEIRLERDSVSIGYIPQKSEFYHTLKVYSVGDEDLQIFSLEPFCDCLTMSIDKTLIPPGDSTELHFVFDSQTHLGSNTRYPQIRSNASNTRDRFVRLTIMPRAIKEPKVLKHLYVFPYRMMIPQYGDSGAAEFDFKVYNKSAEYVPLDLVYADTTYFSIHLPSFVAPNDSATGKLYLNKHGLESEFSTSFTFRFTDEEYEPQYYTVPVKRNIFRKPD
jgi:hypothetical protein